MDERAARGGVSNSTFDYQMVNFIFHKFNRKTKIMDIGAGKGKYGKYLRRYYEVIDGMEVFKEYVTAFNLEKIYNSVFSCDVKDFDFEANHYDVVVFGDVLEHLKTEDAQKVLKNIINAGSSIIVRVPYKYEQEAKGDNIYEAHQQEDLSRETMNERYPYLECLIDNAEFGVYYCFAKNHKVKAQTVIFTHIQSVDDIIAHRNWHRRFLSNVACVRNTHGMMVIEDTNETIDINISNPKSVPDKIMANCFSVFEQEDPFYYILLEWDALIIDPDFEKKCIDYMEYNNVDVMFPALRNKFIDGFEGHFSKMYPNMLAKQWSNTNCIVINKSAIKFYAASFSEYPEFWCEVRFPTVLAQEGFSVVQNPFIYKNACRHIKDKELSKAMIMEGIEKKSSVLHPIKKTETIKFIEEELDKKRIKI